MEIKTGNKILLKTIQEIKEEFSDVMEISNSHFISINDGKNNPGIHIKMRQFFGKEHVISCMSSFKKNRFYIENDDDGWQFHISYVKKVIS